MTTCFRRLAFALCLTILLFPRGQAQAVYVPLHHPIYEYLDRLTIALSLDWDGVVKPASRREVARMLLAAGQQRVHLTPVEREELEYYEKEFRNEILALDPGKVHPDPRWHLFSYSDSSFSLDVDPVFGETVGDGSSHFFNGAKFQGYAGTNFGFGFHFNDNQEKGEKIDRTKQFVPETGVNIIKSTGANEIEYSETRGYVSFGTDRIQLMLGKDFVQWGSGERGALILSDKAPSYPMIRFDYTPVSWLTFHFMHGWLQSLIIDSTRSYPTALSDEPRNIYREKYIAAHMVSVRPLDGLELSVGESIVYSDGSPQILYFIPLIFFRAADHYSTHFSQNDGGNSQIFFDARYDLLHHARMYGTLFIDEISVGSIFDSQKARNQLGYTLGTRIVHPWVEELAATLEYTRILPWVYSNSIPTQLYENSGYLLGHYIGQNADQIFVAVEWRPLRGLAASAYYDYVRRGGKTDVTRQYQLPSLPFLYGDVQRITTKGVNIRYEYMHDLVGKCGFYWQNPYIMGNSFNVELTVDYGLPLR